MTDAGLFKTTDAGANWTAVNAGLPQWRPLVSILEIDPQDTNTLYAVDPCCPNPFKSTNGGAYWTAVYDAARGARLYARDLAIDPRNPRTLYAAGSFIQAGSGPEWGTGVFKSTNGGINWSGVSSGLPVSTRDQSVLVTTLAIDPQNPGTIYAGIGRQGFQARGSGIFKTTNGGTSWSWLNSGLPNYVTALAIDPQNPSTIYAGSGSGVFRSTDGGANWNAVNSGLTTLSVSTLAIDRQNPGTVYAGAADGGVFAITFVP